MFFLLIYKKISIYKYCIFKYCTPSVSINLVPNYKYIFGRCIQKIWHGMSSGNVLEMIICDCNTLPPPFPSPYLSSLSIFPIGAATRRRSFCPDSPPLLPPDSPPAHRSFRPVSSPHLPPNSPLHRPSSPVLPPFCHISLGFTPQPSCCRPGPDSHCIRWPPSPSVLSCRRCPLFVAGEVAGFGQNIPRRLALQSEK